jgi:hypothetical protein
VDPVVEDVLEEVARDQPLAHQPSVAVGEHGQHGVDGAFPDQ